MTSRVRSPRERIGKRFPVMAVSGTGGSRLPKYYSIKSVAEALDVSLRTIRRWIANGDLIVHRDGHVVRIADSDLRTFLALRRKG